MSDSLSGSTGYEGDYNRRQLSHIVILSVDAHRHGFCATPFYYTLFPTGYMRRDGIRSQTTQSLGVSLTMLCKRITQDNNMRQQRRGCVTFCSDFE